MIVRTGIMNFLIKAPIVLSVATVIAACGDGGLDSGSHQSPPKNTATLTAIASMRARWQTYVTGGTIDTSDSDINGNVGAIVSTAQTRLNAYIAKTNRTTDCLFNDLCNWTTSANLTSNYLHVLDMVLAYTTQSASNPYYRSKVLRGQIVESLQWLHDNHYNPNIAQYNNWWDWEIGIPKALGKILIPIYDDLETDNSALISGYVDAMDHFNADPTNETWPAQNPPVAMTGANLLDKVVGRIFSGMLANDSAKITAARNAMPPVYNTVTSNDGFYDDGSFIQHHYISYIGGYGSTLIDDMTNLMYLTSNTNWSFSSTELQTITGWVNNSIAPFMYGGAAMDMTRGRGISRPATTDHDAGKAMAVSVRRLADAVDAATAARISGMIKGWIQSDKTFNSTSGCTSACYFSGLSLYDMTRVKQLLADATVPAAAVVPMSRTYASMARAVHITPTFGFALSMFSDRISSFEFGNGENKKGWLTGAGMTTMYTDDETQFGGNFWATVNYGRLPGTTVDGANFTNPVNWAFYGNALGSLRWTGGSSVLGAYTSAGMEFDMTGFLSRQGQAGVSPSNMTGRKSWFMMDDRIVALGSDLADTMGTPVETIVDNRKLVPPSAGSAGGDNKLTINNSVYSSAALGAGPQNVPGVQWAHLQGSSQNTCSPALSGSCANGSKGIGYIFPTPVSLTVIREGRTGAWADVGTGSTTQVTDNYLSLAIPHGVNPTSASYAYVLLPNKSAAEVNALATNPGISILSNGNGVHAVLYAPVGGIVTRVVGANFWNPGGGAVGINGAKYLTSSTKASVTVAETRSQLSVAVSDPTEANTDTVTVEINHRASSVGAVDSAISVIQISPTIKLSVNVNAAHGRSIAANFNL